MLSIGAPLILGNDGIDDVVILLTSLILVGFCNSSFTIPQCHVTLKLNSKRRATVNRASISHSEEVRFWSAAAAANRV
jgi:hypothetical protein